jgi:hypothetical protein
MPPANSISFLERKKENQITIASVKEESEAALDEHSVAICTMSTSKKVNTLMIISNERGNRLY